MSELEPERKINREDFSKFPNPKAGLHLQDPKQFVEALRLINQLPNPTKGGFPSRSQERSGNRRFLPARFA